MYPNLQIGILTFFVLITEIHVYIIDYYYQGNYCAKKFNPMININIHFGVQGRVRTPGCGLRRMASELIIHTNLHKPNNKLFNA